MIEKKIWRYHYMGSIYWKELIEISENGIYMVLGITCKNQLKFLHYSSRRMKKDEFLEAFEDEKNQTMMDEGFQLVQMDLAGFDRPYERHGNKYVVTSPGCFLTYERMEDSRNEKGRILLIHQKDPQTNMVVQTTIQFYDGVPVARFSHRVNNEGVEEQVLTYLSSFTYSGIEKDGNRLYIPHNGWQKELNWREYSFEELGFSVTQTRSIRRTSKTIEVYNTGNWSAKEYLPMGFLQNEAAGTGLIWQIENNGSWHYEIGDQNDHYVLNLSGPNEIQSHFSKCLQPGETFESVPAAVGVSDEDLSSAFASLTRYRRLIRRPNTDNEKLPVIFNDYMNCLWADPTTEKELPLIDAAAKAGCEYFVIDAGWYDSGIWWDSVGEWKESRERFPHGVREVTDYIRQKGMIPGIWLELEVIGIHSPKLKEFTDDCFFLRHGKRVYDRSRYQLDFRNPKVIAHANEVIDRVVNEYGVGYIKMDYNIEPGIGTEVNADSYGEGLLAHERAYLAWLDSVFVRYPELVIENCSSGGLRMDYALLSRCSIQSTSDQEEYEMYSQISANAATGVAPEQAAVWSYPLEDGDREETIYNMVNTMLLRIHQSGHLARLSPERFALVQEGITCYKHIRQEIRSGLPFWPLGLAKPEDSWRAYGVETVSRDTDADTMKCYLSVWRNGGTEDTCTFYPLPKKYEGRQQISIRQIYPAADHEVYATVNADGTITVDFPQPVMARFFEVTFQ